MHPSTKYALIPAAIPALALTAALPLVNRVEPVILGLPLLLFWTVAWVAATPAFLWLAYLIQRRADPSTRSLRHRSGSPEDESRGSGQAGNRR